MCNYVTYILKLDVVTFNEIHSKYKNRCKIHRLSANQKPGYLYKV